MGRDRLLRHTGLHPLRAGQHGLGQASVCWPFAGHGPLLYRHDPASGTQLQSAPNDRIGTHFEQAQLAQSFQAHLAHHPTVSRKGPPYNFYIQLLFIHKRSREHRLCNNIYIVCTFLLFYFMMPAWIIDFPMLLDGNLEQQTLIKLCYIQYLLDKLRVAGAIFDETATIRVLQRKVCERNFVKASFCRDILFTIAGANPDSFDLVRICFLCHQFRNSLSKSIYILYQLYQCRCSDVTLPRWLFYHYHF